MRSLFSKVPSRPSYFSSLMARHGAVAMLSLTIAAVLASVAAGSASAETVPHVSWSLHAFAAPTNFSSADDSFCQEQVEKERLAPIGCDHYVLVPSNVGGQQSFAPITVTGVLPSGITTAGTPFERAGAHFITDWHCSEGAGQTEFSCSSEGEVPALTSANNIIVPVQVSPDTQANSVLTAQFSVSGGGAELPATVDTATQLDASPEPFGVLRSSFASAMLDPAGTSETRAGAHPDAFTTDFAFPSALSTNGVAKYGVHPVEDVKQIVTELPAGLVGDALAAPTCSESGVTSLGEDPGGCAATSRVGDLVLFTPEDGASTELSLYNVTPERGYAAEFGTYESNFKRALFLFASVVGTGGDTHVQIVSSPQSHFDSVEDLGVSLLFFGDPALRSDTGIAPAAFFTTPSDCTSPSFMATIYVDSWQHPGRFNANGEPELSDPNWKSAESGFPPVTGCERLQFHPTLRLAPSATEPNRPTGLSVNLAVPQNEDPNGLATPPLKSVTVTLPQGLVVSPSSATGLEGCSDAQIDLPSPNPGSCPPASQIGEVTIHTPLLSEPLTGQVFLGTPQCDPCLASDAQSGRMVRLFIQASSERYGVTIKSPGSVSLDPATGRLVSTFQDLPQQPFSDLEFKFKEGPRAPLATPSTCGTYVTSSSLTPWSTPYTQTVASSDPFTIGGCGTNPFTPAFTGGTESNQAGQYSPLLLQFSRNDSEQDFDALEAVLPPGVLAKLAGVPQCGEAELAAARGDVGECPSNSQIGTVTVSAGPGPDPYYTTGRVYLTGSYNGGPFGEAVVVPAVAGPFNLGNVVVRGSIRVDPTTAQGSVVSDPFPSILDGIPLQVRAVSVDLERPGFTFNATSCEPTRVTGTLVSTRGVSTAVSSPYQAANCASLPFKPVLTASTSGKTSKAAGASLHVKIDYPANGGANLAKVDLEIPKALPSRLTTLQKACTEAQFNANPASCPAASDIATAVVRTPLLSSPLAGPVYFVSHGGAAFPDTEIVLQGEGVRLIVDGHTQIKHEITYSRFETVPDAPISSFEFVAAEGPYSIFSANVNLCALTKTVLVKKRVTRRVHGHHKKVIVKVKKTVSEALAMPTTLVGQNGAVIKQNTKIEVAGCPGIAAKKATVANKAMTTTRAAGDAAGRTTR